MNLDILVEQIGLLVKRRKQTSETVGKFACHSHQRRRLYYESWIQISTGRQRRTMTWPSDGVVRKSSIRKLPIDVGCELNY